jgi:hypothetical protein
MSDTPETDGQLASVAHEPRDVAVRKLAAALRGMERQRDKLKDTLKSETNIASERTRLLHDEIEKNAWLMKAGHDLESDLAAANERIATLKAALVIAAKDAANWQADALEWERKAKGNQP